MRKSTFKRTVFKLILKEPALAFLIIILVGFYNLIIFGVQMRSYVTKTTHSVKEYKS